MKGGYRWCHDWRILVVGLTAWFVLLLPHLLLGIPPLIGAFLSNIIVTNICLQLLVRAWRRRLQLGQNDRVPSRALARSLAELGQT